MLRLAADENFNAGIVRGLVRRHLKFLNAPRRISWTGDRTPAPEVLAIRNLR